MKTFQTAFLFTLLASGFAYAQAGTNGVLARVQQATKSNDVAQVLRLLPEIEKLWPEKPREYFESGNLAARAWKPEVINRAGSQALSGLFTNMIQKPLPEDNGDAAVCVESKKNAIRYCFGFDVIREDRARWVETAKFVGEVRERIIPNYKKRTAAYTIAHLTPQRKQALDEAYRKNFAMDDLQSKLSRADSELTSSLENIPLWFPTNGGANTNFIEQVISAAHFTPEEAAKFRRTAQRQN